VLSALKKSTFYAHIEGVAQQKNITLEEAFKAVRELGYTGFDCDYESIKNQGIEKFKEYCKLGFKIVSVYRFFDFGNIIDENEIIATVDLVEKVGCPKIMVIPGFYTDENRKKEQFQNMVKGITFLCEEAAKKGITVSVEDYDRIDSPCCLPDGLGAFLDAIPTLRFTVDTGNFYYSRSDLSAAYHRFKEKTVHAHLKDRSNVLITQGDEPAPSLDGTPMYPAPVGGGILPIKNIVQDLLKEDYDGYFTVEMFGSANYYDYLEKSADFLDNIK
jgi:inosose dehydratase